MERNTVISEISNCSATHQNLSLWKAYRNLAIERGAQALNFVNLPSSAYKTIIETDETKLGRISAPFFCSFTPKKVDKILETILDNPPVDISDLSEFQVRFSRIFWAEACFMARSAPMIASLKYGLPMSLIDHLSVMTSDHLIAFPDQVARFGFNLRFNPNTLEEMLTNDELTDADLSILKLIQLMQTLGQKDLIHRSLTVKQNMTPSLLVKLHNEGMKLEDISARYGIKKADLVVMLRKYRMDNNEVYLNKDELQIQAEAVSRDIIEELCLFGLTIPQIAEVANSTNSKVRTIHNKMRNRHLVPSYGQPAFARENVNSWAVYQAYASASIFVALYYQLGSESITRTINSTAMIWAHYLTLTILSSPVTKGLDFQLFHPSDAYYWAKCLRESSARMEFCKDCGCLHAVRVSNEEEEKLVGVTRCPFCLLIEKNMDAVRSTREHIKTKLETDLRCYLD